MIANVRGVSGNTEAAVALNAPANFGDRVNKQSATTIAVARNKVSKVLQGGKTGC